MKQFLLSVDENGLKSLMGLMPALQFIEVVGMTVNDNPNVKLLGSPCAPAAAEPAESAEPTEPVA